MPDFWYMHDSRIRGVHLCFQRLLVVLWACSTKARAQLAVDHVEPRGFRRHLLSEQLIASVIHDSGISERAL